MRTHKRAGLSRRTPRPSFVQPGGLPPPGDSPRAPLQTALCRLCPPPAHTAVLTSVPALIPPSALCHELVPNNRASTLLEKTASPTRQARVQEVKQGWVRGRGVVRVAQSIVRTIKGTPGSIVYKNPDSDDTDDSDNIATLEWSMRKHGDTFQGPTESAL